MSVNATYDFSQATATEAGQVLRNLWSRHEIVDILKNNISIGILWVFEVLIDKIDGPLIPVKGIGNPGTVPQALVPQATVALVFIPASWKIFQLSG